MGWMFLLCRVWWGGVGCVGPVWRLSGNISRLRWALVRITIPGHKAGKDFLGTPVDEGSQKKNFKSVYRFALGVENETHCKSFICSSSEFHFLGTQKTP